MNNIKISSTFQHCLPTSVKSWRSFLLRALQRPLADVPFPDHFYLEPIQGERFSVHKPELMEPSKPHRRNAVLVLLSPAGEVLTSSREDAGVARTVPFQDLCITITKRAMSLRIHGGELSFPGGHINNGETALEAALRETREEIGLDVPQDWIVGHLSTIPSSRGYPVTPVVALAPRLLEPVIASPDEVDSVHYVHVSNLLLRSEETFARVMKPFSRVHPGPCLFPCFFSSPSPLVPSESVLDVLARVGDTVSRVPEDAGLVPLEKENCPGEIAWGLTNFITCELVARLAVELQAVAANSGLCNDPCSGSHFLRCTNIVARDPSVR